MTSRSLVALDQHSTLIAVIDVASANEAHHTADQPARAAQFENRIGYLVKRPIGRPAHEVRRYHARFTYPAQSWKKPRRVAAKVEWQPGELYPRVGSSSPTWHDQSSAFSPSTNQRGTAEQWIKEGEGAIKWTRLSCRTLATNAVRLQLRVLALILGISCGRWRCSSRRSHGR